MLKDKKILVTGITGRLGGAFADALAPHNEVWGLARFGESTRRDFNAQSTSEYWAGQGVTVRKCDLGLNQFDEVPEDFDYVLHPAANLYTTSLEESLRDNVDGTAFLMQHCRRAKAFLHVSTSGVYAENPDPYHMYREDIDPIGGGLLGYYTGVKTATEGAARAMSQVLNLPTIMCRLQIQYGTTSDGGLPVKQLRQILDGVPIRLPKSQPMVKSIVHNDDLIAYIEPCLNAATVPAIAVNWGSDEVVRFEEYIDYMGELVGVKPIYDYEDGPNFPMGSQDPARRRSITGPSRITWREGLKQVVEYWEPILRAAGPAKVRSEDQYKIATVD